MPTIDSTETINGIGLYLQLYQKLRNGGNPDYWHHDYFRMNNYTFDYILGKIRRHVYTLECQNCAPILYYTKY